MAEEHAVELIFFAGCPHVGSARANLADALDRLGAPPVWREWDLEDPAIPARAAGHGSPTVLVAGRDVTGTGPDAGTGALACRAWGAPTVGEIVAALTAER